MSAAAAIGNRYPRNTRVCGSVMGAWQVKLVNPARLSRAVAAMALPEDVDVRQSQSAGSTSGVPFGRP